MTDATLGEAAGTEAGAGTARSVVEEATAASAAGSDERLAYRGVFARLLVRPEIGSVIAVLAIWTFFWAVTEQFGKAGGAASILDVASTLGIMAVAVSMLMIGGEFDLSSGAATGAFGILTLLLVRDVTGDLGGAGLSLWIALPVSLLLALGLGWFNGFMVNRTSLPSFIVTLGSFFIIRGAKLGFAKLIVDQIQVGKMDDLAILADERGGDKGYDLFNKIFAAQWDRNSHVWEGRDTVYTVLGLVGLGLAVLAVHELRFLRKERMNATGLAVFAAGLVGVVAGVLVLHNTDGSSGDTLGAAVIGASMLAGLFGLGVWRYEPLADRGSLALERSSLTPLLIGLGSIGLSVVFASVLDAQNAETLLVLLTEQGIRAILFVGLAAAGFVLLLVAANRAGHSSQTGRSAILVVTSIVGVLLAFYTRSASTSPKFRTEAFSVMLLVAALVFTWSLVTLAFAERRHLDLAADHLGNRLALSGLVLATVGVAARLLFTVQAEIDAGIPPAQFSVRTLWFLAFTAVLSYVLGQTRFGSWTFAVGGNKEAARQIGVPAARTKIQLFMIVSFAAWLVGTLLAFRLNTIQAGTGNGLEFEYIIAAVVGGTALTGGYGSTIGAAIGALIMAMSVQGIPYARWNTDWRYLFLGVILLTAVIANNFIRSKAEATR
jgi:ribose/xylose/arabinose/galactoside ABC-type transport system permease subunit